MPWLGGLRQFSLMTQVRGEPRNFLSGLHNTKKHFWFCITQIWYKITFQTNLNLKVIRWNRRVLKPPRFHPWPNCSRKLLFTPKSSYNQIPQKKLSLKGHNFWNTRYVEGKKRDDGSNVTNVPFTLKFPCQKMMTNNGVCLSS